MELSLDQRIAGVLAPVFAIRGANDLGIGDTSSLKEFIDWAASAGFRLVKILPINETGGDHSPYNAISSIALEPTTMRTSPEALKDLRSEDYETTVGDSASASDSECVDYSAVKSLKRRLLEMAFANFERKHLRRGTTRARQFATFHNANAHWLDDYSLFRVLLDENRGLEQWPAWQPQQRHPEAARAWLRSQPIRKKRFFRRQMEFYRYVQWQAFLQWQEVKAHATSKGIALMGDIPFGVSYYSADVWAQPQLFQTGWCGGTPPDKIFKHDAFVQKWGQNWGIPLYDWKAMRATNFAWWRQRVRMVRQFFHLFRIDHVLGFYRIYGFPWRPEENAVFLELDEKTAMGRTNGLLPRFHPRPDDTEENRRLNSRDGEEYLRVVVREAGAGRVIGEDLGEVPEYVRPNLTSLGIAGYKIPAWEKRHDGGLIRGSDYQRLSLATYGTHDHEPLRATWEELAKRSPADAHAAHEMRVLSEFAGINGDTPHTFTPALHDALLKALFCSNSWIAVVMITDLFGRVERFNYPGVASGENWTQRLHAPVAELRAPAVVEKIRQLLQSCGRAP